MNVSKHHSNEYFGPGIWYTIHSIALTIKKEEDYYFFIKYMKWQKIYFPCEKCRVEFEKYLQENPFPEIELENMRDTALSCFVWTFYFHNFVNQRLNKNVVDIETAYETTSKYIEGCSSEICKL